jgi:hypothetical protein
MTLKFSSHFALSESMTLVVVIPCGIGAVLIVPIAKTKLDESNYTIHNQQLFIQIVKLRIFAIK